MSNVMNSFKVMLIAQLFFSICITIIAYSIPADAVIYMGSYTNVSTAIEQQNITSTVRGNLNSQTNLPLIELGALIFYSGNIIIDLILNFFLAVPEMFGLIFYGISYLFGGANVVMIGFIQLFITTIITTLYILGIISLLMNMRSRTGGLI